MALSHKNKVHLKTTLKTGHRIYPRLKWGMKFLSLPTPDLAREVIRESEENPFLELETDYDGFHNVSGNDSDNRSWENIGDHKMSIFAELNEQTDRIMPDQISREILELIFSSLNERGFSTIKTSDLLEYGYTKREIKKAHIVLKQLEPAGIGAENIFENLLWQAEIRYKEDVVLIDILDFLSENYTSVLKDESIELSNDISYDSIDIKDFLLNHLRINANIIDRCLLKIQKLNPYPLDSREIMEKYIFPDIIFQDTGNGIQIEIPSSGIPNIHVNEALMNEFLEAASKEEKEQWKLKYDAALIIKDSIEYRKSSLAKLGKYLLKKQAAFFKNDPSGILPLNLSDAAKALDLHISSVSRLVSEKYCETKWGTHSLKIFFPHGIKTNYGLMSIDSLKKKIIQVIESENPQKPLSDQKISDMLKNDGVHIERRTVAKYRNLLHIPSAFKRKAIKNIDKGE